jgi:hypothetical protein
MISKLFDRIAEIKTNILNLGLDENSREFLKYDITIQYYSDKLQNLQNKTNPGIDQEKVEIALQKITEALDELESESNGAEADITDIDSPDAVEADAGFLPAFGVQGDVFTDAPGEWDVPMANPLRVQKLCKRGGVILAAQGQREAVNAVCAERAGDVDALATRIVGLYHSKIFTLCAKIGAEAVQIKGGGEGQGDDGLHAWTSFPLRTVLTSLSPS